jgi:adenylate cyclase
VSVRVPRTFLFVDLSGFTNYCAENGDEQAGRVLSAFRVTAREIASERGVRIAKWLGDGCMMVAVDQLDAIAAAIELEHRASEACTPLAVRVGMASGYALLFEGDDYIGQAVNLAARLCDVAGPFEVLMPAAHIDALPSKVKAAPHRAVALPGFPDPIDVVELSGPPPVRPPDDLEEQWTRTPFVA